MASWVGRVVSTHCFGALAPPVGRVKTMEFVGTKLMGNLFASED